MSSSLVEVFQYSLPLVKPLRLAGRELTCRSGLILKFGYGEREVGYGDIAPLPGFSRETLEEARDAVTQWAKMLGHLPKSQEGRDKALEFLSNTSSVLFGIECATFSFRHAIGSTRSLGLYSKSRRRVSVCGLLMGSKEDVLEKAGRLRDEGYRAVKLKVGRQDVAQDIELVQELRGVLRGHASLRLDANRAWDLETALTFARGVANQGIEYIEEPITVPLDLPEFVQRSGLPVALDESLAQVPETRGCLKDKDWAKAVILKPTLLGGVARCEQLAYEALEFGIKPVVSSCFESGLGLCALAHLASAITAEDIPAGLDTYDWLAEDVLQTRFHVQDGALDIQDIDACAATLNVDTLERVYSG